MSQEQDQFTPEHKFSQQELDAIGAYQPDIRHALVGQNIARTYLAIGFVAGLIAQVVGYLLKQGGYGEPFGLAVDLLYALGWSMWTGVVVAVFVDILPAAKRNQITQALAAYEEYRRQKGHPIGTEPPV